MGAALKIGITGLPGAGKTYALLKVIEMLEADGLKVGGMITEPIVKRNRREGFYVMDYATKEKRVFASREIESKTMVGRYGVDITALEEVGVNALRNATENADVIVIDEVGKMEVESPNFVQSVKDALDADKPLILTLHKKSRNPLLQDIRRRKGPLPRGDVPFYNPTNAVNRDVSAVLLARWPGGLRDAFDGLAATGAWAVRIALEASVPRVVFNDRSRDACDLVRANLDRNHVDGEVRTADMQDVLRSESFDFVDIDPFGPPTPFLRAAIAGDRPEFGLGVTATDTAPLSGTYPEACVRRYGARPLRCPQGHEIGLRILIGHIARRAAEAGRG